MAEPGITITRIFDAPRERVWKEWIEPERFSDWFGGPAVVPLSTVEMDVRPGGSWRLTMFADPGRREINWRGEYREVVEPERLVFTYRRADRRLRADYRRPDRSRRRPTEMFFRQSGGKLSAEEYERAGQGWGSFFDRIAERLADQ